MPLFTPLICNIMQKNWWKFAFRKIGHWSFGYMRPYSSRKIPISLVFTTILKIWQSIPKVHLRGPDGKTGPLQGLAGVGWWLWSYGWQELLPEFWRSTASPLSVCLDLSQNILSRNTQPSHPHPLKMHKLWFQQIAWLGYPLTLEGPPANLLFKTGKHVNR